MEGCDRSHPRRSHHGGSMTADNATDGGAQGRVASWVGTAPIDQLCIDTIRTLSIDAVQAAESGHAGAPMALAPVAYTLWQHVLSYDPHDPAWPNRDRFVLSNGHASMLLYSILHLAGVSGSDDAVDNVAKGTITLDDIKRFRQLDSRCAGHPEHGLGAGIETTTGPLGQGCGNSVGMALAGRWLAGHFNKPGHTLFDYNVYAICSDGDMMEGVASEAASLAGHLMLGNLCWLYDSNRITIEGHTDLAFSDDVAARFLSYGWNVLKVGDANDTEAVAEALDGFRQNASVPTLIIVESRIGYGSPHKQGTAAAHSDPLGVEEVRLTKRFYGWPEDAHFLVPDGVREHFAAGVGARGARLRGEWETKLAAYRAAHPDLAAQLDQIRAHEPPSGWDKDLPAFPADPKGVASRDAAGKALNVIAPRYPWLLGGAADLAPSTKTKLTFEAAGEFSAEHPAGRNLHFGIREHAMGAIANGMAVSGLRPFAATFLIFSDYMKHSIRLAGLMDLPVVYVFTHDSVGVGEDGPTHQPIEQLIGLRAIPRLIVLRPGDANEAAEAWRVVGALRDEPAALILSRQALPTLDRTRFAPAAGVARGAYVLSEAAGGAPEVILIGTGSEVSLCVQAQEILGREGVRTRVVSMPSWELFERQDQAYRDLVLPPSVAARVSVEAGSVLGWDRYVGPTGTRIGMNGFGASAPIKDLMRKFGFTPEAVADAAREQRNRAGKAKP